MLSIGNIQTVIASSFFDGNLEIAGLLLYSIALAVVLALTYKPVGAMGSILLGLPVTVIFSSLGVLGGDLMIIMIIVLVLALGVTAAKSGLGR